MCRVCIDTDAYETDKNPESFIRGLQKTMVSTKGIEVVVHQVKPKPCQTRVSYDQRRNC